MNSRENPITTWSLQNVRDISVDEVEDLRRRFQATLGPAKKAYFKSLVENGRGLRIWSKFKNRTDEEDMWVEITDVDLDMDLLFGTLDNEPRHLTHISLGSVVYVGFQDVIKAEYDYRQSENTSERSQTS